MKKAIFLSQIAAFLFACPIAAEEPPFDLVRGMFLSRSISDFFSEMIVRDFLEKNQGYEEHAFYLASKVKPLMIADNRFEKLGYVVKDFIGDDLEIFMMLKRSGAMNRFQVAEQRLKDLELPTYEKELSSMIPELNHK